MTPETELGRAWLKKHALPQTPQNAVRFLKAVDIERQRLTNFHPVLPDMYYANAESDCDDVRYNVYIDVANKIASCECKDSAKRASKRHHCKHALALLMRVEHETRARLTLPASGRTYEVRR